MCDIMINTNRNADLTYIHMRVLTMRIIKENFILYIGHPQLQQTRTEKTPSATDFVSNFWTNPVTYKFINERQKAITIFFLTKICVRSSQSQDFSEKREQIPFLVAKVSQVYKFVFFVSFLLQYKPSLLLPKNKQLTRQRRQYKNIDTSIFKKSLEYAQGPSFTILCFHYRADGQFHGLQIPLSQFPMHLFFKTNRILCRTKKTNGFDKKKAQTCLPDRTI